MFYVKLFFKYIFFNLKISTSVKIIYLCENKVRLTFLLIPRSKRVDKMN